MVIGPVSMPLIGRRVWAAANRDQSRVIGSGRATSPNSTGGFTQRDP